MTDAAESLAIALADRYTIERELGAGGMATVYLAEDLKHHRKVAVKVLRPELAAVLGAERFVQEITTTANLQHPHILPLFDSGEADGFLYYVMPFIDGETLRDKLNRETQLGIEEAVKITTEVADALDYAHRNNVIHRDIKPENILLHDGRPTVADFGIALAVSAAAGGRMTETGLSLGTPHYMSPEQATAEKDLTHRSDIYSLGAVLYEMLTGDPPHVGSSAQQIIMKIVTDEARPVTELRRSVPPNVAAATAKALEKLPADRFETAAKLGEALANPNFTVPRTAATPTSRVTAFGPWNRLSVTTSVLAVLCLVVAIVGWLRSQPNAGGVADVRRFSVRLPDSAPLAIGTGRPALALTSDGSRLVFVARIAGEHRLLIKDLVADSLIAVSGSEGGTGPFLSLNGRIGFFEGSRLLGAPVAGGPASRLGHFTPVTQGAAWLNDSSVAVSVSPNSGVLRSPLSGPSVGYLVDTLNWLTPSHGPRAWPELLPGGRAFVYAIPNGDDPDAWSIGAVDVTGLTERIVVEGGSNPRYAASGHLVFVRQGGLWAVPFDSDRLTTRGSAVLVQPRVLTEPGGIAHFSLSRDGALVYAPAEDWDTDRRLVWVSPDGSMEPLSLPVGEYVELALGPDGRRVALTRVDGSNYDVWLGDLTRGSLTPKTRHPGEDGSPVWSPNGNRIAIATEQFGDPPKLAIVDLREDEVLLAAGDTGQAYSAPTGWTRDGRSIFFVVGMGLGRRTTGADIDVLELEDGTRASWLETSYDEVGAVPSPDGRWIAYVSDQSGRYEVNLRSRVGSSERIAVSTAGGIEPHWGRSGALYFRRGDRIMKVTVTANDLDRPTLAAPQVAFRLPSSLYLTGGFNAAAWDIAIDERRILALDEVRHIEVTTLNVVLNFFEVLKQRVGNGND